jgi:hypothetical protein
MWATWPLARHLDEALPADLGDPLLNTWILGWDADRLAHGLSGLWDAPIFFPYHRTLAFSEHLLGIAVPVAPIVWLTGRPFVAYNVAFIASFVLAAGGMYLLVGRLTGRRDAACLAGLVFAFAPSRFGQIGHLQVLMSGWMPIALWGLHRYFDTGSRCALAIFTAAFLVQGLSNGYYIYFLALPVTALIVYGLVVHASRWRRIAGHLVVTALVVLTVLLPIANVYFEVRREYGLRRLGGDVVHFGADLGSYLQGNQALRPPITVWRALPHYAKPAGPEGELFPGLVALALTLAALYPVRRRQEEGDGPTGRSVVALYAGIGVSALILSLGTSPTAWGRPLPIGFIYRWLFAHAPGFDGLRVPARLSVVVLLSIAVLVGFGFARVSRRWPFRVRTAAVVALGSIVMLEGVGGAMPLAFLKPAGFPDRAAYTWIRDRESGPVLELPAGQLDTGLFSFRYQYQTLVHRHRIVNGATGYGSGLESFLGSFASPLREPDRARDALEMLRALGIRCVVVHPDWFPDLSMGTAALDLFRRDPEQVPLETSFPGLVVFRLAPWREDPDPRAAETSRADAKLQAIPPVSFRATASQAEELLGRAFDGDLDSRWYSGTHQTGDEWIEIAFDRPRDVARVRLLASPRSVGDYPRELVVESAEGSGPFRLLYRGSIVRQLALGLVSDPRQSPVDVWLARNATTRLRIRQVGQTRRWFWSVDELSVWEPIR